jgi:hypothetical protein
MLGGHGFVSLSASDEVAVIGPAVRPPQAAVLDASARLVVTAARVGDVRLEETVDDLVAAVKDSAQGISSALFLP